MQKYILLFILYLFFFIITVKGQINVNKGDSVFLSTSDYRGTIQWQISSDGLQWNNIADAFFNTYKFTASENAYYRAMITEGACFPEYSDSVLVLIKSFICGDILKDDRDNKEYKTVKIGDQCWMAENINIGLMLGANQYQSDNQIIEKYCANNDSTNCNIYGGLYDWGEIMNYTTDELTKGICPTGWHIPSDNEYKTLEIYLGMTKEMADIENNWRGTDQGTKMLNGGSSGFNALLSGGRTSSGSFLAFQQYEYLWTSTQYGSSYAWRRCLRAGDPTVGRWNTFPKNYAFSVRCLKN